MKKSFGLNMNNTINYFSVYVKVPNFLTVYKWYLLLYFRWNNLRDLVDQKREEINLTHGFQNFHIECNETIVSILDILVNLI